MGYISNSRGRCSSCGCLSLKFDFDQVYRTSNPNLSCSGSATSKKHVTVSRLNWETGDRGHCNSDEFNILKWRNFPFCWNLTLPGSWGSRLIWPFWWLSCQGHKPRKILNSEPQHSALGKTFPWTKLWPNTKKGKKKYQNYHDGIWGWAMGQLLSCHHLPLHFSRD